MRFTKAETKILKKLVAGLSWDVRNLSQAEKRIIKKILAK